MMLRTPTFWSGDSALSRLLIPFSRIYAAVAAWRRRAVSVWKGTVPVVCVGNLTAGGAGKTPVAVMLARILLAEGKNVHFLTRGYGGRLNAVPTQVDASRHTAEEVGDEALLLAACAPCWVSADRVRGAQAAEAAGAEILVLDDGFQNPALHKDVSLLVVDGEYGFGNGRLLPAGPLRESVEEGLVRASAVLLLGEDKHGIASRLPKGKPLLRARVVPSGPTEWLKKTRVTAFAGIARPEKFFSLLEALGSELTEQVSFPDHYPFRETDMARLAAMAERHKAQLVTTEKDAVRLPPEFRRQVRVLPVEAQAEDPVALRALLASAGA